MLSEVQSKCGVRGRTKLPERVNDELEQEPHGARADRPQKRSEDGLTSTPRQWQSWENRQCSQLSRPDCRALASNSPVRTGRGWYGRPAKASVLTTSRKTAGPGHPESGRASPVGTSRHLPSSVRTGFTCRYFIKIP